MVTVTNLDQLDGIEIRPSVFLIGKPGYHVPSRTWRCLANVEGMLALVELSIKVLPDDTGH
jgi:hypothetical protein